MVVVEDDGRGMPDRGGHGRHGLANLRERARRWQGDLQVGPSGLGGTRVVVRTSLDPLLQNGDAKAREDHDHSARP